MRKQPTQGRSRSTVEYILEAAAQVFGERGYVGGSTSRIAERTGVSVGSLYQYFPTKDALLVWAIRRRARANVSRIAAGLDRARDTGEPVLEAIRLAIDQTVEAHVRFARLQRGAARRVPGLRESIHEQLRPEMKPVVEATARLLTSDPSLAVPDPNLAAAFIVDTLHERLHWFIEHGPAQGVDTDAFVEELDRMITHYVRGWPANAASGRARKTTPDAPSPGNIRWASSARSCPEVDLRIRTEHPRVEPRIAAADSVRGPPLDRIDVDRGIQMRTSYLIALTIGLFVLVSCPTAEPDDDASGDDDVSDDDDASGDDDTSGDDDASGDDDSTAGTDEDGDGWTLADGDCDDSDPTVHPGADEGCDGIDTDCDGDLGANEIDDDGDGFTECAGDCDDADDTRHPDACECTCGVDSDCDGIITPENTDGDGDGWCPGDGDCDDSDPARFPGNPEACDGIDNNCDGEIDEACGDCSDGIDNDGDGWIDGADPDCADPAGIEVGFGGGECNDGADNDGDGLVDAADPGCSDGGDPLEDEASDDLDGDCFTTYEGDCDDTNPSIHPDAPDVCDGIDNDCDGVIPMPGDDLDGDGHAVCDDQDDQDPAVYPGATEICDGKDNDCDGQVPANEADADCDGWRICDGDCEDADPLTYPGAPPYCGSIDANCDGLMDPHGGDDDGDGYEVCFGDCNDLDPTIHPGAPEIPGDGIDNDCDGVVE